MDNGGMPPKPIDYALERADIIARFRGHASLAALYAWIAKFSVTKTVDDSMRSKARPPALVRIVPPTRELSATDWLQQSFDIYNQMAEISRREDGTIKNVRIAGWAAEGIRKTVQTRANIHPILQEQEMDKHRQFCDDVVAVIKQEDPKTRNRIFQRLRALVDNAKAKAGYGV
jgi:hypothetical protein